MLRYVTLLMLLLLFPSCSPESLSASEACEMAEEGEIETCSAEGRCWIAPGEFLGPCIRGCFLDACSSYLDCPEDARCGASCADLEGATFWKLLLDVKAACELAGSGSSNALPPCARSRAETACPELVGTGWEQAIPVLR